MGFSKMFVCFPVKKSEKKQKSLKGTSVAFNVKEKTKIPGNFCPETNSIIGEHVNIQFGSFKSSRHFWDVNTPIFTHEKCQKIIVCCFSYPKLLSNILRRIFCHRRKHKHYLSTLVFVTP